MARTKSFDRELALENAMDLFWKKGYHDTSMQDLVDNVGLNRSSLYDTFGDKYGLFISTLDLYTTQHTQKRDDALASAAARASSLDLRKFLKRFLDGIRSDSKEGECGNGCFMVNTSIELAAHDEKIRAIVQSNMEAFVQNFTLLFQRFQEVGQLPKSKDPEALANFLYAATSGMKVISRTTKNQKQLDSIARTVLDSIVA